MISKLPTIHNKEEFLKTLDLDEFCFKILTYMLVSNDEEFSHNQLRKELDKPPFSMREPTFSNHLKHLENKKIITRDKSSYKTKIRLNEKGLFLISRKKEFKKMIKDYSDAINNSKKLSTDEIYQKLERYSIDKVYKSLYIKLTTLLDPTKELEKIILYKWINVTHDNVIDIYLNELTRRGTDDINKVLEIHLNHPRAIKQ